MGRSDQRRCQQFLNEFETKENSTNEYEERFSILNRLMESISNSGVSLILNPEIANAIDDHHQHDLSTCEEEFENPEEIQQMLVNAFDSQSLSNTDHEDHENSIVENHLNSVDDRLVALQDETENLRRQLNELTEKYEEKLFSLRLDYESKMEKLTHQLSDQQMEMLTLKQINENLLEEKSQSDEKINEILLNEHRMKEKFDRLQIDYDQLVEKTTKKATTKTISIQTENDEETELKRKNLQLIQRLNEREQFFATEKNQYENRLKDLSKRPTTNSIKLQTEPVDDDETKKLKQMQNEIDDYKLKLNSKQIELNTLKFDFDNLKQEMNDRLSLLTTNFSTEQMNKVLNERDEYLRQLNQLKNEVPQLKQQMIENFQTKMISFKEQVKKSLNDKEKEYQKRIEQMENEYIAQYEQVLEKNKQILRGFVASKDAEKAQLVQQYEEKLKAKNGVSSIHHHDEIHRLYDQIAKQNQQQIVLIDEHQKQIEQLKINYDQRYRVLLDEWKTYNNELQETNLKFKGKLKEYEKTIVQLRYHIVNLQIEYLQNGGNSKKILSIQ